MNRNYLFLTLSFFASSELLSIKSKPAKKGVTRDVVKTVKYVPKLAARRRAVAGALVAVSAAVPVAGAAVYNYMNNKNQDLEKLNSKLKKEKSELEIENGAKDYDLSQAKQEAEKLEAQIKDLEFSGGSNDSEIQKLLNLLQEKEDLRLELCERSEAEIKELEEKLESSELERLSLLSGSFIANQNIKRLKDEIEKEKKDAYRANAYANSQTEKMIFLNNQIKSLEAKIKELEEAEKKTRGLKLLREVARGGHFPNLNLLLKADE